MAVPQPVLEPMVPVTAKVLGVRRETPDTWTLSLEPDRPGLPAFRPGQFNMVYAFGIGEVPISISGDPARPERLVHTVRAVGAVTRALAGSRPGQVVGLRGPFGTAWPVEEARGRDLVVAAGGIGLAPLRPVLYHVLSNRADYDRVVLLYGARSRAELLYRRDLERWRGRFDLDVLVTVDRPDARWRGNVGVVTALFQQAAFRPEATVALVCGPEVMIRFTLLELEKRGVPDHRTYVSLERNMKCGVGTCGHCQLGPVFVCHDGPVFRTDRIRDWLGKREP